MFFVVIANQSADWCGNLMSVLRANAVRPYAEKHHFVIPSGV